MANTKGKKALKVTGITFASLIGLIVLALAIVCIVPALRYRSFYANSDQEFSIPGLRSGFIPQGFNYVEEKDCYVLSGYNKSKNKASCLYIVSKDGKSKKQINLNNKDGEKYTKHCGGVTVNGNYIYVAGDKQLDVFSFSEAESIKNGESITQLGSIDVASNASYTFIHDGKIYSGEFYKAKSYENNEAYHITTKAGDSNYAMTIGYALDDSYEFGVNPTPVDAYSTIGLVQGMCFTNDYLVLSTSWGISASKLYFYDVTKIKEDSTIKIDGVDVPYYSLDSSCLSKVVSAPPMAEELDYVDDKIIFINESATTKYIFGNFIGGKWARSYYSN